MHEEYMGFGGEKAIAVLRVSSHRQKDGASHDVQESKIREYAELAGLVVVRSFPIVESAKASEDRHKYQAAMTWAKNSGVKHVCFYMMDRETRNLTDNERNETLVRSGKLVLHYVNDGKVIDEHSPDSDFFMRDVHAVTAKNFCRVLGAKVIDSQVAKARDGWFPLNHPPLGYAHHLPPGKKRGTTIIEDPRIERVRWVRREFELRAQGYSVYAIRERVLEEGLVPFEKIPSYYTASIHRRLINRFYWGEIHFRGEQYLGKHPLIIPRHHLDAVAAFTGQGKKLKASPFLFGSGFLTCYSCGCWVCGERRKGKYTYYRCTNGRNFHDKKIYVPEAEVMSGLAKALDEVRLSASAAKEIAAELNRVEGNSLMRQKQQAEERAAKLLKLEKIESELYDDFKSGILTREMYEKRRQQVFADRSNVNQSTSRSWAHVMETARSTIQLAQDARTIWDFANDAEKKFLLEKLLSNKQLDGRSIRYDLRKEFLMLRSMGENGDWRAQSFRFLTLLAQAA
jgi:site-specific DNA recombinase